MKDYLFYIIIIVVVVVLYFLIKRFYLNHVEVMSNCGLKFDVVKYGSFEDMQKASNILCELNKRTHRLIRSLRMKYGDDDPRVTKLIDEHDNDDYVENQYESYNLGKGQKINMCIRNRKTGEFYSTNTLMFVILHEQAHTITNQNDYNSSIAHTEEFYKNFKWLLNEAMMLGIYQYVNYNLHPVEYCNGVQINGDM